MPCCRIQPWPIFSVLLSELVFIQDFTVHGSVCWPLRAVKSPCTLSKENRPKIIMFPHHAWQWGCWCQRAQLWFHLTTEPLQPSLLWVIQMFIGKPKMGLYMRAGITAQGFCALRHALFLVTEVPTPTPTLTLSNHQQGIGSLFFVHLHLSALLPPCPNPPSEHV